MKKKKSLTFKNILKIPVWCKKQNKNTPNKYKSNQLKFTESRHFRQNGNESLKNGVCITGRGFHILVWFYLFDLLFGQCLRAASSSLSASSKRLTWSNQMHLVTTTHMTFLHYSAWASIFYSLKLYWHEQLPIYHFHKDRTESATWFPRDLKPNYRTITLEIITTNDMWDFQLKPLNLTTGKHVLFQPSVYVLRRPQNLNEVKFV